MIYDTLIVEIKYGEILINQLQGDTNQLSEDISLGKLIPEASLPNKIFLIAFANFCVAIADY